MGRQSHQAPFPIAARTSSINAETKMRDERRLPRQTSQGNMRMAPEKNKPASSHQSNAPENSAFHRELRVRASSPLLGRSYQSHRPPTNHSYRQPTRDSQQQPLPQGSRTYFPRDPNFDKYAFDTQSQRNLALGVVDDMRGIGFPLLEQRSETASQRKEQRHDNAPKKRPSRLDLSLLFPKPKPEPAPLLSPQRYTKSPSPVTSEFSTKAPPNKLIKPRSRGNIRAAIKEISPPIPLEPPVPPTRVSTRKPAVDWFDVPLEKIIRLGETLEVDAADENSNHETFKIVLDNSYEPKQARHSRTVKPSQPPMETVATQASSAVQSHRSSLTSSTASRQESRRNRDSKTLQHRPPQSSSGDINRPRASLQSRQSEGDLRAAQLKPADRILKKKKSSSTFETLDLTKNSVLSLSSSEDEDEEEDENTGIRNATPVNDAGKNYQTHLARKDAGSRGPRESFATNDYIEPEICRTEAIVARKSLTLNQLGRTNSTMSQVSSDSYTTQRRPIPMRPDSFSSISRSTISMKIYAPPYLDVPLIEEPEEPVEEPQPNTRQLRLSSQFNDDPHSVKRRSRIIAVTRQEESLLEAMRLRDGRLTPSIFRDISDSASDTSAQDRGQTGSTTPALTSSEPVQHNQFDTSFLRLSTVMQTPPIGASSSTESASAGENDTYLSYRPISASDQRTEQSNSHFTASPRLSLAYSETPSSSSTMGHASPVTPTLLPGHRFSQQAAAPPPSYAPPPVPDDASSRGHSRRRTDSSEAIVLEETEAAKLPNPAVYPLWAVKWTRDPDNMAVAH